VKIHIVQKGDTLWKIAKKYGVNFEELKKMNSQLSNPDMIMPGMKIKVPTTGGMVKKEAPIAGTTPGAAIQLGAKKEMPILEHPFAKEQPKPLPIVEAPKKEMPIIKEAPKAPYIPKMPLPVIPEIDINNYYMMNMASMNIQQPQPQPQPQPQLPPKPVILPEVKEAPKPEVPVAPIMPVEECPPIAVEQPMCPDYCVPVSPVMPGPGCIYPMDGYPVQPVMPYQQIPSEAIPMTTGMMPPTTGVAPAVAGTSYIPPHFDDESSSFMPQMPMHPTGGVMGAQNPMAGTQPMQTPYMQQAIPPTAQMPMGYPTMPGGYPAVSNPGYAEIPGGYPVAQNPGYAEMPGGYPVAQNPGYAEMPGGYPVAQNPGYAEMPGGYPVAQNPGYAEMPGGYPIAQNPGYAEMPGVYPTAQNPGYAELPVAGMIPGYQGTTGYPGHQPNPYYPGGYGQSPVMASPYGQMPYGYPQMGYVPQAMGHEIESPSMNMPQMGAQTYPMQGQMPVGTGPLGDCGCGAPPVVPQNFVPTTPPVYSAPYTAPMNIAQPPYMNPYGIGPMGASSYAMPRYDDESNDY
jgi:morphogenetic protein associated with SpoVID